MYIPPDIQMYNSDLRGSRITGLIPIRSSHAPVIFYCPTSRIGISKLDQDLQNMYRNYRWLQIPNCLRMPLRSSKLSNTPIAIWKNPRRSMFTDGSISKSEAVASMMRQNPRLKKLMERYSHVRYDQFNLKLVGRQCKPADFSEPYIVSELRKRLM